MIWIIEIKSVDIIDFTVLVGNCLDNALEATAKIKDPNKRWISIKINLDGTRLSMLVSNSVSISERVDVTNHIKTSKKDKTHHGLGLKSIKKTVSKYNGVMDFDCNDERFVIAITLG